MRGKRSKSIVKTKKKDKRKYINKLTRIKRKIKEDNKKS
jgi:hypothetical protein